MLRLRPRTLRRLLILLAVLLPAAAALAALRAHLRGDRRDALLAARAAGLDARAAGDFPRARRLLGRYLAEFDADAVRGDLEARLARADALSRAGRHAAAADLLADALADAAELGRVEDRLPLYHARLAALAAAGRPAPVAALAEEVLGLHPDDPPCLRFRRDALDALGRRDAALDAARRVARLRPDSYDDHRRVMALLAADHPADDGAGDAASATLVAYAAGARPGGADPLGLMLLAAAYDHAGQGRQAAAVLDQAADLLDVAGDRPDPFAAQADEWAAVAAVAAADVTDAAVAPPAAAFDARGRAAAVLRLADLFAALGRHDRARAVLLAEARRPDAAGAVVARAALLCHEAGDDAAARSLVGGVRPNDAAADVAVLGVRGWVLPDSADAVAATLRRVGQDAQADDAVRRAALAWADLLAARGLAREAPPRAVDLTRDVAARVAATPGGRSAMPRPRDDPRQSVPAGLCLATAAGAFEAMLEPASAASHWRMAAEAAPGWWLPAARGAELELARGRPDRAYALAEEAARRAALAPAGDEASNPRGRAAALLARAAYARWRDAPAPPAFDLAAALVDEHQRRRPGDPRTLPAHVRLTAVGDPGLARQLAGRAAEPAVRLAVAREVRDALPDLAADLLDGLDGPRAALLRARLAGRDSLDPAGDSPAWRLAAARLSGSARDWAIVLGRDGGDPALAAAALGEADALRRTPAGRDLLRGAVATLRDHTGGERGYGRRWRLHGARLDLAAAADLADPQDRRAVALRAADALGELAAADPAEAEVWRLLGEATLLAGNPPAAAANLRVARRADPARAEVALRLIDLLDRRGRSEEAGAVLADLAASGERAGDPAARRATARRLAQAGDATAAAASLSQADAAGVLDDPGRLLLARLLARLMRDAEAREQYARLAESDDPAALAAAAAYFARSGDAARSAAALRRLEALDDPAALAAYHAATGDAAQARRALSGPRGRRTPRAALAAARAALAHGRPRAALDVLGHPGLDGPAARRLRLAASAVAGGEDDADDADEAIARRVAALLADAAPATVGGDVRLGADLAAALETGEVGPLDAAARLLPDVAALTRLLIDRLADPAQAARVARRAADAVPADAELQRLAYAATRDAGASLDALWYARRWSRSMSAGGDAVHADAVYADTAVADALLALDQPGEAAALALKHLDRARTAPGEFGQLLGIAAEALAATGDAGGAFEVMLPYLHRDDETGAGWRLTLARLAGRRLADAGEARRWLRTLDAQLARLGDGGSPAERLEAAEAWARLGARFDDPDDLGEANRRLAALLEGPLRSPTTPALAASAERAWATRARLATLAEEAEVAESAWRRALALAPRRADAAAALAYLLLSTPDPAGAPAAGPAPATSRGDVARTLRPPADRAAEAVTWATVAAESEPTAADYQELLARAREALGDAGAAAGAFERALRLDPDHLGATLGLATLLLDAGPPALPPAGPAGDVAPSPTTRPAGEGITSGDLAELASGAGRSGERAARLFGRARPLFAAALASGGTAAGEDAWPTPPGVRPHLRVEYERLAAAFDGAAGG